MKWGNALGGWKKQRRSNKGQFGFKPGGKVSGTIIGTGKNKSKGSSLNKAGTRLSKSQRRAQGLQKKRAADKKAQRNKNLKRAVVGVGALALAGGAIYAGRQQNSALSKNIQAGMSAGFSSNPVPRQRWNGNPVVKANFFGSNLAVQREGSYKDRLKTGTSTIANPKSAKSELRRINTAPSRAKAGGKTATVEEVLQGTADMSQVKGRKVDPKDNTLYTGINADAGRNGRAKGVKPASKGTHYGAPEVVAPIANLHSMRQELRNNSIEITRRLVPLRRNNADEDTIRAAVGPLVARNQEIKRNLEGTIARRDKHKADIERNIEKAKRAQEAKVASTAAKVSEKQFKPKTTEQITSDLRSKHGQRGVRALESSLQARSAGPLSSEQKNTALQNSQKDRAKRRIGAAANIYLGNRDLLSTSQVHTIEAVVGKPIRQVKPEDIIPYAKFARRPNTRHSYNVFSEDDARPLQDEFKYGSRERGRTKGGLIDQTTIVTKAFGWESHPERRVKQTPLGKSIQARGQSSRVKKKVAANRRRTAKKRSN